jgi:hypothetical protein
MRHGSREVQSRLSNLISNSKLIAGQSPCVLENRIFKRLVILFPGTRETEQNREEVLLRYLSRTIGNWKGSGVDEGPWCESRPDIDLRGIVVMNSK